MIYLVVQPYMYYVYVQKCHLKIYTLLPSWIASIALFTQYGAYPTLLFKEIKMEMVLLQEVAHGPTTYSVITVNTDLCRSCHSYCCRQLIT